MFGYILPAKPEMKVREWTLYRAYYCGLCKELKREYGFTARLFLNYDLVLPAILTDSLTGRPMQCRAERCIANPVEKRCMCQTSPGLALAADALILSVYYKLADDLQDEKLLRRIPSLLAKPFLARMRKKAAMRRPQLDGVLAAQSAAQAALEKRLCTQSDEAAEPTGLMTAEIFSLCAQSEHEDKLLRRLGLFMGKIIYYLDAAEDYEKDAKRGSYNVFRLAKMDKPKADKHARQLCNLCAGEINLCYNLLECKINKGILDNIIFLGLPQSIALAGTQRTQEMKKHKD